MLSALVGFIVLVKYPTFGREQPEVAVSPTRRVRSLANHRSLIYRKKKFWFKREECVGALSWWRRQLPVDYNSASCAAQHHVGDGWHPCSRLLFGNCLTVWCELVGYNKNPTRAPNTTSLKSCLPSTDAIDRRGKNSRMRIKFQSHLMQARFIQIDRVFEKKTISETFLTDLVCADVRGAMLSGHWCLQKFVVFAIKRILNPSRWIHVPPPPPKDLEKECLRHAIARPRAR